MLRGQAAVPAEKKRRMAARLIDGEFFAPYGMFSISRSDDLHWDREDCDWGGGGMYVGVPGRIAETLFKLARGNDNDATFYSEKGWEIMARISKWVEKFPYFPQTLYGDNLMLQPHERNWFLQLSAGAGAQAIISGIFGLRPQPVIGGGRNLSKLIIAPARYNATVLGDSASLTDYRFMGHVIDVLLSSSNEVGTFVVRLDGDVVANAYIGASVMCHSASAKIGVQVKCDLLNGSVDDAATIRI